MTARRALALLVAGLLGGASSLLVACGSGNEKLIPPGNANALQSDLEAIRNAVTAGRCTATQRKLTDLRSGLNHLPSTVDPALRQRLDEGYSKLLSQAAIDCKTNAKPKTTPTTTTETTSTETAPTTTTETTTVTVPPPTTPPPTVTAPTTTTSPTTTGTGGIVPTGTVPSPSPEPRK